MTTLLVSVVGALGLIVAGFIGFAGRLLIDRPQKRDDFLLNELRFYAEQYPKLRDEVAALTKQIADERATHTKEIADERAAHLKELTENRSKSTIELAERDATIAALSVRVSELERQAMTPQQRAADVRRQQRILDRPDSGADGRTDP